MNKVINGLLVILFSLTLLSPLSFQPVLARNSSAPGQIKNNQISPNNNPPKATKKPVVMTTPTVLGVSTDYNFEVLSLDLGSSYGTNRQLNQDIIIKNTSNAVWDKNNVKLSYHWLDQNGEYEIFKGDETSLLKDMAAGETSTSQRIMIKTPEIPGNFKLSIDLIRGVFGLQVQVHTGMNRTSLSPAN